MIFSIKTITMVLAFINHVRDNAAMNWTEIIQDLINFGLTQSEIAQKCGTGQSYISSLLGGDRRSPNWQLGDSLIRLHRRQTRKTKKAA